MFTPTEIDAVLSQAEQAVSELAAVTGADPPAACNPAGGSPAAAPAAAAAAATRSARLQRILNIRVPLIVRLATRRMPIGDIMHLTLGSILEFESPVDGELELRANNKTIGGGEAIKVGECFGLRIKRLGDLRSRIESLAP